MSAPSSLPSSSSSSDLQNVDIQFFSHIASLSDLPSTPFTIPTSLTRYGLSEIVNTLLSLSPTRPFDFLLNGAFLRTNLLKFMTQQGLTGEGGLMIEVIEALPEPVELPALDHPDWLSSVCGLHPDYIVTGCYDGWVRIFTGKNMDKTIVAPSPHSSAIKCVSILSDPNGVTNIISAGKDRTVKIHALTAEGALTMSGGLSGDDPRNHSDSIHDIDTLQGTRLFATASWDRTVAIWDLDHVDPNSTAATPSDPTQATGQAQDSQAKKKQRVTGKGANAAVDPATRTLIPICSLTGHSQPVTAVAFPFPGKLYSASYDQSIKLWDIQSKTAISAFHSPKPVAGLAFNSYSNLLASCHHDRVIRVWDPRQEAKEAIKYSLKSHNNWVTSVSWSNEYPLLLLSSSLDGTVKLWDIRSNLPLNTMKSHTDKVFSCDFNGDNRIISGGADKKLRINRLALNRGEKEAHSKEKGSIAAELEEKTAVGANGKGKKGRAAKAREEDMEE